MFFFIVVFVYMMMFWKEVGLVYVVFVLVVMGVVIVSGGEFSFYMYGFVMCVMVMVV